MREQLVQYVNLLFAGAPDSEEIREEILQNTLERYEDLLDQGKSPEAAYRLAISGIGDVNEILGSGLQHTHVPSEPVPVHTPEEDAEEKARKRNRAVAVAFYICCPIPLIALSSIADGAIGICLTLLMVAAATFLLLTNRGRDTEEEAEKQASHRDSPAEKLKNGVGSLIWAIGLAIYFLISFTTRAWHITWIIFPIIACVNGLFDAIIDLKEANKHEN